MLLRGRQWLRRVAAAGSPRACVLRRRSGGGEIAHGARGLGAKRLPGIRRGRGARAGGRARGRAGKRARGGGARMIIPVRCFTCGKVIGNKYENYMAMLAQDGCSEA